jgi:hypothetical protein
MPARQSWRIDEDWYRSWLPRHARAQAQQARTAGPLLSILMPVHDTDAAHLDAAIASVRGQSYANWELCIVNDGSSAAWIRPFLDALAAQDSRIRVAHLPENRGIAAASNAALTLATGDWILPMDHDDLLAEYALGSVATHLEDHAGGRFFYSDSDRIDEDGCHQAPFFKPEWNYLLFLAQNYLNHLTVIDAPLLRSVGGWRDGFDGSQDYDLYLRLVERLAAGEISRIPALLYHWRVVASSFSRTRLGEAVAAARRAVAEHLERTGQAAQVTAPAGAIIYNRIVPPGETAATGGVLLITYGNGDAAGVAPLAATIDATTRCHLDASQNLPSAIDARLHGADQELVVLIHASCAHLARDDLLELLAFAQRDDAGCTGVKCVSSAGTLLTVPNTTEDLGSVATLPWHDDTADSRGYHAHLLLQQETAWLAPTLVALRRRHWQERNASAGDPTSLAAALAELCLTLRARGFRNRWLGDITATFGGPNGSAQVDPGALAAAHPLSRLPRDHASRFPEGAQWIKDC